jgi:hypothetical protein
VSDRSPRTALLNCAIDHKPPRWPPAAIELHGVCERPTPENASHAPALARLDRVPICWTMADPFDNTPCEWPGCTVRGNPMREQGWCWAIRKYRWLPEGFYCPTHEKIMREGIQGGDFEGWPLDNDPVVLETLEAFAAVADPDSVPRRKKAQLHRTMRKRRTGT